MPRIFCNKKAMKRNILILLTVIALIPCFGLGVCAYSEDTAESIADAAGANDLSGDYLSEEETSGEKTVNIFEKVILITADAIKDNSKGVIASFGGIMAVVVLCCVMHAMKFGDSQALDVACDYISVLVLSGVTYSILYNLFILVIASMEALTVVMSSLMPIMASLYVFGGNAAAGAASTSASAMFLTVLSAVCTKGILPMLRVSFALCLTGAMPGSVNLSAVTNFVKSLASTLLTFIFTLLGFVLYFQTAVASASDSFFTRSVKFASGVFVPIIGSMLGEATRTVMASVSVVKGTVGTVGVTLILSVILPPVIAVALNKLMLLGCSALAKTLGCERESALLYDLGSVLSILLALTAGAGTVCIIAMAVFIKTGVAA